MGSSLSFPWSCHVHGGVNTRSPRLMTHLSPSTVVKAPSPWMMNRIAAGE